MMETIYSQRDKIFVVLRDGRVTGLSEWQTIYGLKVGTPSLGKYFSYTEERFQKDLKLYGMLIVNELLIRVLDQFREDTNEPETLNAFNRNQAHQDDLTNQGYRTATYSPHVIKMQEGKYWHGAFAADIDTKTKEQTLVKATILLKSAEKLHILIRIGFNEYLAIGQTFIHVDVGPEYYGPFKPWNKLPHPVQWERAARKITDAW